MKRLAFIFLLTYAAWAQPKIPLQSRINAFDYDSVKAAYTWLAALEEACPDTTIGIYLKYTIRWQDTSWGGPRTQLEITFDSVRGRGAARQALITASYKTWDSAEWIWTYHDQYDTAGSAAKEVREYDSLGRLTHSYRPLDYDTLMRRTPDSTHRHSIWMAHLQKDYWNQITTSSQDAGGIWGWTLMDTALNRRSLDVCLEKVTGDPTKNNGWNQQARIRFAYQEQEPAWFRQKFMRWDPSWDTLRSP